MQINIYQSYKTKNKIWEITGYFRKKVGENYFWGYERMWHLGEKQQITPCELYKKPDLVKYIKIKRLVWAGHLARIDSNKLFVYDITVPATYPTGLRLIPLNSYDGMRR